MLCSALSRMTQLLRTFEELEVYSWNSRREGGVVSHHVFAVGVGALESFFFRDVAAVHAVDGPVRPRVALQLLRCPVPDARLGQQTVAQETDSASRQRRPTTHKPVLWLNFWS